MNEDCCTQPFRFGKEGMETRIADGNAVDIAADLDPGKSGQGHDALQFRNREIKVLHGQATETDEASLSFLHQCSDDIVDVAG
jgi:hypothetical protein